MLFDTHAHYDDERFDEDRDALLTSMPEHNSQSGLRCGDFAQGSELCTKILVCICCGRNSSGKYQRKLE